MDLPGLTKKEIAITRKQDILNVRGEREVELTENEHYKRKERKSGAFMRSFAIPEKADASNITASFRNGVLTIQLPMDSTDEDTTHIPVQ
jgi:HSP20 family protein